MQFVSLGDNLHGIAKPILGENEKEYRESVIC